MTQRYRVQLYWAGRANDRTMDTQLEQFVGLIGELHPVMRALSAVHPQSEALLPLPVGRAWRTLLEQNVVEWELGEQTVQSYTPRFVYETTGRPKLEFEVTLGIPPSPLEGVFLPNRLEFFIHRLAAPDLVTANILDGVLNAGIQAFDPDWGYVGTENVPAPRTPIFNSPRPQAGWLTYLRRTFNPVPSPFPEAERVIPVENRGTVIVAHRELFNPHHPAHLEAIERVENALDRAGSLQMRERRWV